MKDFILLDLHAQAGDIDLGSHSIWLPKAPIKADLIDEFPFEIPAWRITIRKVIKITLTLMLRGTISRYYGE